MKRVFVRGARLLGAAALLAGGWGLPAVAADLGGDCCADLEERVAELEATAARKGNRKVSLTISGWVNEAVFAWDDGKERNTYIGTNSLEQSRFRFVGQAKITDGWSAGYVLEIGLQDYPSSQWDASGPAAPGVTNPNNSINQLLVRKSNWFVKSDHYGQVAVGLNGSATYHLMDDADITQTRNFYDAEAPFVYNSRFKPGGANGLRWTDIERGWNNSTPGQAGRRNIVRYDTPTWEGFTASAAWGEDDLWDVALYYKNDKIKFIDHEFAIAVQGGYGQSNGPGTQLDGFGGTYVGGGTPCISNKVTGTSLPDFQCNWGGVAATVLEKASGLYAYGGWGEQFIDTGNAKTEPLLIEQDSTYWFTQLGIERKWCDLGKTTVFGQYSHQDAGSNPGATVSADVNVWAGGVVQGIDAAAMQLYFIYQHSDGDVTGDAATQAAKGALKGTTDLTAFQEVIIGGKVNF